MADDTTASSLVERLSLMRKSFFDEGILHEAHFIQLEKMAASEKPDFLHIHFTSFLDESKRSLNSIKDAIDKVEIEPKALEFHLLFLKARNDGVRAPKIGAKLDEMMDYYEHGNFESVKKTFEELKAEVSTFKSKIEPYLELIKEVKPK